VSDIEIQLARAFADASSYAVPTPAGLTGHDVLFYRTDAFLTRTVVDFLAEGVSTAQPIIVIATEEHRRAFADGLRAKGLDPEQGFGDRRAVWIDARETLETLMEGSLPSRELCAAVVADAFERLIDGRNYVVIRCYGEMVDLLWKDGKPEAAFLLEKYWNELADRYKYSLLCGYAIGDFMDDEGVAGVRRICEEHKHVLPLESLKKTA
jgi:hypothetical protein